MSSRTLQLAQELALRRQARTELMPFNRYTFPAYIWSAARALVCRYVEAFANGRIKRLMVWMPPQYGKPVDVESQVLLDGGHYKRLGDIEVGDWVMTHAGVTMPVIETFSQGELPVVEIRTESGRKAVAAYDHPFLTPEGWINAGDLRPERSLVRLDAGRLFPDRILTMEPSGSRRCRCLSVAHHHTFTVEDLVVHNSEIISRRFPPWFLGQYPDEKIIQVSYSAELALEFSRDARRTMREELYQSVFGRLRPSPIMLDPEQQGVNSWRIFRHRGGLTAAGIGGGISGRGASRLSVDDLVKNRAEARSKATQKHHHDEYHSTLRTRLSPDGGICIVQTRWDENDLSGKLLQEQDLHLQDQWTVLRLPLVAETPEERHRANEMMNIREVEDELGLNPKDDPLGRQPGDPLDPARHDREACAALLAGDPLTASSVWQQSPRPVEGSLIKRHWFEIVEKAPSEYDNIVRSWDLAATEKETTSDDPDFIAGGKMLKKTWEGNSLFFLTDMIADRVSPLGVEKLLKQTARLDGRNVPIRIEQEPGATGKLYMMRLRNLLQGYRVSFAYPSGDKVTRAMPWISDAEAGNIKLVNGPWVEPFLRECESFPDGAHDDMVDATSIDYEALTMPGAGKKARTHG